jgi:flagellar biosynthesis/type III secretory pathway M-ring protein FliF/YscJ
MDQQVSPAVVVIVLILIVAILVGLYFLVVERGPQSAEDEAAMEAQPMEGDLSPGAETVTPDDGGEAEDEASSEQTGDEETDADDDGETAEGDAPDNDAGDPAE